MSLRSTLFALLISASGALHAATEVIAVNYRTADEVLPVAQSVLGNEGRVTAYGNQLIVNAAPEKISELRSVIEQLDAAPQRLLISVDTNESGIRNDLGYRVDGSASIGNAEIIAGEGEINGKDQVRIIRNNTSSSGSGVQQIQATSGYPALIQVGQSVPLTTTSTGPYGQQYSNTQYRNVTKGFYVTATVNGDRVQVSISSNNDRLSRSQPGAIDVQSTDTRVNGRLGEWITLGGVSSQNQSQDNGFLQRYSTGGKDDMSMRIKVDAVE